jgi:hypothetical protein
MQTAICQWQLPSMKRTITVPSPRRQTDRMLYVQNDKLLHATAYIQLERQT